MLQYAATSLPIAVLLRRSIMGFTVPSSMFNRHCSPLSEGDLAIGGSNSGGAGRTIAIVALGGGVTPSAYPAPAIALDATICVLEGSVGAQGLPL